MNKTKTIAAVAFSLVLAISLSSCKSKESLYKKAYEKAQAMNQNNTQVADDGATVNITPVQPTTPVVAQTQTETPVVPVITPTTPTQNSNVRVQQESVQMIDGVGLKAYSVVCGSFSLQANAVGLQQKLKQNGYQAQIVLNAERKLYRVIASTHETKELAIDFRNRLRESYPDAWLLYKK